MEMTAINATSEEREEGEIVEDDLEDVSDCSMAPGSPLNSGKSVSPPEPLSAVCLSSVSGSEYSRSGGRRICDKFQFYGKNQPKRRIYRRKRKLADHSFTRRRGSHHLRHHKRPVKESSESESESVDPRYAKQLREALQHPSKELHNSLKTRLKAFIQPQSDDEANLEALRDFALLSTLKNAEEADKPDKSETSAESGDLCTDESKANEKLEQKDSSSSNTEGVAGDKPMPESIDDPELRELRIAALRSFIMENHERRKKKAIMQDCNINNACSGSNKDEASDIDKENDQSIINNDLDGNSCKRFKLDTEKTSENEAVIKQPTSLSPISFDDKTVDSPSAGPVDSLIDEDADILRAMLLASLASKITEKKSAPVKNLGFPKTLVDIRKVERSKTNYNSLSVTITKPVLKRTIKNDLYGKTEQIKTNEPHSMPNHVIVKPLIININAESDSDTENCSIDETGKSLKANVTEFLKKQRAEVEAAVKKKSTSSDSSLNKSDDPLMEKSVMKLLPRSQQLEYRKLKQQLLNARKRSRIRRLSQRLSESKREAIQNNKKVPKFKTDVTGNGSSVAVTKTVQEKVEPTNNLQKTLGELQIRKNGRLQMKGKYRSLAPLLHRINQVSNERRQHELEIKKLLQEIQKARTKLAASHQNFTELVQQLLTEKCTIDQRLFKLTKISHIGPFTSTPNKLIKKQQPCNLSSVKQSTAIVESSKALVSSTTTDSNASVMVQNRKAETESNAANGDGKVEEEEVLLDPNDVTKVFVEPPTTIPKYTSPLDNREGINDPLTTICPYDLLGVCKDRECRYMHCS